MYKVKRNYDFTNLENSEEYKIYEEYLEPHTAYLIEMSDVKIINKLIDKYKHIKKIPNDHVFDCLEFIKTNEFRKDREVWKVISQITTPVQINRLYPALVWSLD